MSIHPDYIVFTASLQTVKLQFFLNKISKHENFVNKWPKFKFIGHP